MISSHYSREKLWHAFLQVQPKNSVYTMNTSGAHRNESLGSPLHVDSQKSTENARSLLILLGYSLLVIVSCDDDD